ncbi:helix-turn-helix domain-containing protein, partial [bacterium]|nr:helix-turn-helix domain-containing protein [bacterium]NIO17950.1 helix-turn-helix domain-containing protein [bacterium]NIO73269.1 helix-turn-helix domain-containing protein [bacterium]
MSPRRKLALIQTVEEGKLNVSQACQKYRISRKTFYKWLS